MVTRGRKIVDQAHKVLLREGVPHGVLMAGHKFYRPHEYIQIASVDTLRARGLKPKAKLLVLDEGHLAVSKSYKTLCANYPDAHFLPVTATPFSTQSLRHCADVIVNPITMAELIEQGYLVPGKYYAPSEPDLSGVSIDSKTKDFNQKQLGEKMDKLKIVGNLVEEWKKYGQGRPTVAFAVNVEHSKHIAEMFCSAGISAIHCDANSPDYFRNRTIERLQREDIKVITNVGLFGIGVDMPFLSCTIFARPTESVNLYLQQCGRPMRPFPDKKDYICLDHAGNVLRHGFPTDTREPTLDGKLKKSASTAKRCEGCFAVVPLLPCEFCGWNKERKINDSSSRPINQVDGTLSELTAKDYVKADPIEIRKDIREWDLIANRGGFKLGFTWHKCKEKYGSSVATFYLADRFKRGRT